MTLTAGPRLLWVVLLAVMVAPWAQALAPPTDRQKVVKAPSRRHRHHTSVNDHHGRQPGQGNSRRSLLGDWWRCVVAAPVVTAPAVVRAAMGAAELDAGFYARALLNGNTSPKQEKTPLVLPTRPIDAALAQKVKASVISNLAEVSGLSNAQVDERFETLKGKLRPAYQARTPFEEKDLSDGRTYDFNTYVWWRLVTDMIETLADKRVFAKRVGEDLLAFLATREPKLARPSTASTAVDVPVPSNETLTPFPPLIEGINAIGATLKDAGFVTRFTVETEEDAAEDWEDGYSTDVKYSFYNTVTTTASLQLADERRPFRPDLSSLLISAFLRSRGVPSRFEEYFLDETYRPDPTDFRPEVILENWTLKNRRG